MNTFPFAIVGFDLDGTLLDTHRDLAAALNHALAIAGRPPLGDDVTRALIGGGTIRMLEGGLARTGGPVDPDTLTMLRQELIDYYAANSARYSCLFPGGEVMLDAMAALGVKVGVVTNKLERLAVPLLKQLGLFNRFSVVLGGDSLGPDRAKPKPDLLQEMVRRIAGDDGDMGRTAFVGDTTFDIRAARAAGFPSVAVSFGFNDKAPHDLGADAVINHFDALIPTLRKL